jgi:hypothetical protein
MRATRTLRPVGRCQRQSVLSTAHWPESRGGIDPLGLVASPVPFEFTSALAGIARVALSVVLLRLCYGRYPGQRCTRRFRHGAALLPAARCVLRCAAECGETSGSHMQPTAAPSSADVVLAKSLRRRSSLHYASSLNRQPTPAAMVLPATASHAPPARAAEAAAPKSTAVAMLVPEEEKRKRCCAAPTLRPPLAEPTARRPRPVPHSLAQRWGDGRGRAQGAIRVVDGEAWSTADGYRRWRISHPTACRAERLIGTQCRAAPDCRTRLDE